MGSKYSVIIGEILKPHSPEEGPPLPKGVFPSWPGDDEIIDETLKPHSPEEGPPLPKGIFPSWPGKEK